MSRFLNGRLKDLEEYTPGEQPTDQKYIKLNTNESPYPPSPRVVEAIGEEEVKQLRLYSDPESCLLKAKLAETYRVRPENVFVANGSDEILNFAFMAYAQAGAAFPDLTYGFYRVFADLYGIPAHIVPLKEDFTMDVEAFMGREELVVIANPNAPTGLCLEAEELEKIVASCKGVVLVDEAYVDFGGQSAVDWIQKYANLLVIQTFSKSRSMAGARLGYAFAHESLIRDLEKIKYSTNPYNINRLTQAAGAAALEDPEYYRENCDRIIRTRSYVKEELLKRGFTLTDSRANFLFAASDRMDGETFYRELKKKGVLIRHFRQDRIRDYNRITIGSPEEMKIFLEKTDEVLAEAEKAVRPKGGSDDE